MKHCAKCRFEKHFHLFSVKKAGLAGVILMGLHLAFHAVELLILPSVLLAFGGHAIEEPVMAATSEVEYLELTVSVKNTPDGGIDNVECERSALTPDIMLAGHLGAAFCAPTR